MSKTLNRTLIGLGSTATIGVVANGYFAFNQVNPALSQGLNALGQTRLINKVGLPVTMIATVEPHSATLLAF